MQWICLLLLFVIADGHRQCFKKYENRYFVGSVKEKLSNMTVSQCLSQCLSEARFLCRSVTFVEGTKDCFLNDRDKTQDPHNYIVAYNTEKKFYYQRKCFGGKKRNKAFAAVDNNKCFQRIPGKVLIGVINQLIQDVASEQKCQKLCEKQGKNSDFICRSAMYYPDEQECILASQTRKDMPDLFITDPQAIYMENRCIMAIPGINEDKSLDEEHSDRVDGNSFKNNLSTSVTSTSQSPTTLSSEPITNANMEYPVVENLVEEETKASAKVVTNLPLNYIDYSNVPVVTSKHEKSEPQPVPLISTDSSCCSPQQLHPLPHFPSLQPSPQVLPLLLSRPRQVSCCSSQLCCFKNPTRSLCPPIVSRSRYNKLPHSYSRPFAGAYPITQRLQNSYIHEGVNYATTDPAGYMPLQRRPPVLESGLFNFPNYISTKSLHDKYTHVRSDAIAYSYKPPVKHNMGGILVANVTDKTLTTSDNLCFKKIFSRNFRGELEIPSRSLQQCQNLCRLCDTCLKENLKCIAIKFSIKTMQCAMSSIPISNDYWKQESDSYLFFELKVGC